MDEVVQQTAESTAPQPTHSSASSAAGLSEEHQTDDSAQSQEPLASAAETSASSEMQAEPVEVDNLTYLQTQLERLTSFVDQKNFSDFWFYSRELRKEIFLLKGVPRAERKKLKEQLGQICEQAKQKQEELLQKMAQAAELKLVRVKELVQQALSTVHQSNGYEEGLRRFEEASQFLRHGEVTLPTGETIHELKREDFEIGKKIIQEAKDQWLEEKRKIRDSNFQHVLAKLNELSEKLLSQGQAANVLRGIRGLRQEMKKLTLDRTQWREIDQVVSSLWKKAKEQATIGLEHQIQKRIEGLERLIARKEQFIATLQSEIDELKTRWANVKNDFFKNRMDERISEKQQKIDETRSDIVSVKEKIRFLKEQQKRTLG